MLMTGMISDISISNIFEIIKYLRNYNSSVYGTPSVQYCLGCFEICFEAVVIMKISNAFVCLNLFKKDESSNVEMEQGWSDV